MKAGFFSKLDVHLVSDSEASGRGLWKLDKPLVYWSVLADRQITVKAGFITDFASVPRLPIAFLLFGDTASRAAVIHDWLYSTALLPRALCDDVLKEAALSIGVPAWRANLLWAGVRMFGGSYYGKLYKTN